MSYEVPILNIWKELRKFAELRQPTPIETTLLGDVPTTLKDGHLVSRIPAGLSISAWENGLQIIAADFKTGTYTLRLVANLSSPEA